MIYNLRLIILVLLCVVFYSCSKNENNNSNNFATGIVELPALRNGANDVFVTHYTTFNGQKVTSFSMEYDKSKKHSRWIAFRFDNQTKQQNVSRSDEPFDADPAIGSQYQRVQADFGKQGYDRGHLCASADRLYSREVNEQTFYYTNMSPQRNKFNTGIWLTLEGQVQSWGRSCTSSDTLYVVKEERLIRKIRSEDILVTTVASPFLDIIIWLCCLKKEIHSKRSLFGWSIPTLRNQQS